MSATISRKKGWGDARFDDRLNAHNGSRPVFRIPAAIQSGAELLFQNY
jgi:hypothetical protein